MSYRSPKAWSHQFQSCQTSPGQSADSQHQFSPKFNSSDPSTARDTSDPQFVGHNYNTRARKFSPKFNSTTEFNSSEPSSPGWTTSADQQQFLTKKNPQLQPLPSSHYSNSNNSPRKNNQLRRQPSDQRRFESWRQFSLGDHAYVGDLSSKESSNATKLSSAEYNSDPTTIFRETTRTRKYQPEPTEIKNNNSSITNSIQGGTQTTTSERYSKDTFKRDFSLDHDDLNFSAGNYSSPPAVYPSENQSSSDFRSLQKSNKHSDAASRKLNEPNRFKSWRKYNLEDYIYVGNISKHSRDHRSTVHIFRLRKMQFDYFF